MEINIEIGATHAVHEVVLEELTAPALGSGSLEVYATPAMAALMENAAADLAEKYLPPDLTTVGIALNIAHKAASPVGITVRAEATVISVEGRKIVFSVAAADESGEIGSGTHERFIVNREKFLAKAADRLKGER